MQSRKRSARTARIWLRQLAGNVEGSGVFPEDRLKAQTAQPELIVAAHEKESSG